MGNLINNIDGDILTATYVNTLSNAFLPIGSVVAWHKSLTGVPSTLPMGWTECDGKTISDTASPYNGVTIPNLNNNYYLQGSTTSGTTGGSNSNINTSSVGSCCSSYSAYIYNSLRCSPAHYHTVAPNPPHMTIVWIMRYK